MNDEQLAVAAGTDREQFSLLLERHYDRIFAMAFSLTGNRNDAEDLTQDICLALPEKIQHYRPKARFTTWLYRVIANAAHDQRRRQASRAGINQRWGQWQTEQQTEKDETIGRFDWLQRAINHLPVELRDTLLLTLNDVTQAEVAEVLGVSEGTVSWRISQAKNHLRNLRAQEEGGT